MVTVKWTDQAIQDIDNISSFITRDSEKYARIQAQRFFDAVEILKEQPKFGQVVQEISDPTIRQLLQGNYRIIYKIVSKGYIHILTVHHSRRLLLNNPAFNQEQ
jgi:toxin ParE1/3/4